MSTPSWFGPALALWYREHQRPLPWRQTRDPYRIWLSEVILQQTRVDQGTAYWHRFVERFPTVADLAQASEDEVLRLWQGLGYYSRARNLRTAAQHVLNEHSGRFPPDHAALLGLKGVGDYTASAIASICFGIPEPVVDGNVYRVLSRVFGITTPIDGTEGRKQFRAVAAELLVGQEPGAHNQAVMELGATVCTPRNPRCGECPLAHKCIARAEGTIDELPVKTGKTKVRARHFNYLLINVKGGFYLRKRAGKDIWQGLWELPLIETGTTMTARSFPATLKKELGAGWTVQDRQGPVKHILSHQVIHTMFWELLPPKDHRAPAEWKAVKWKTLDQYGLPRLIERHLANYGGPVHP
ncbi:MAG: A/G-specific adenine glycosylase [Flavobacteriales bacterium]|jgi:A/G-specific adenine glycosylase